MNGYELKQRMEAGGIVYGTMLSMSRNPRWAAPMSNFGLDYVVIDTEHSPRGRDDVADFLAAFNFSGVVSIVRVPIPDSHYITMALDAGAHGILAPYCETVDEVQAVVATAKWHPLKGENLIRAVRDNILPSPETRKYLRNRRKDSFIVIGIESEPAHRNLDAILHVGGIIQNRNLIATIQIEKQQSLRNPRLVRVDDLASQQLISNRDDLRDHKDTPRPRPPVSATRAAGRIQLHPFTGFEYRSSKIDACSTKRQAAA